MDSTKSPQTIAVRQTPPPRVGYRVLLSLLFALLPALLGTPAHPPSPLHAQDLPFAPDAVDIVGGQVADPGEYPWQVILLSNGAVCGGALIDPEWVLTAAHCVWDEETGAPVIPEGISVYLGKFDISRFEPEQQVRTVAAVEIGYYNSYDGDIALLRLTRPAELSARVATIAPLRPDEYGLTDPGTVATATGWGVTSEDGNSLSALLREVQLPLVSYRTCQDAMPYFVITDGHLCAGYPEGGKDTCFGDSGGPLAVQDGAGGWKLAGLTSFGYGCARAGTYGVYTRITAHVGWIQDIVHPTQITEIRPTRGRIGTVVEVWGRGFTGVTAVTLGGVPMPFSIVNDVVLQATVPSNARSGKIAVVTPQMTVQSSTDFQVINTLDLEFTGPALGSVVVSDPRSTCAAPGPCTVEIPNGSTVGLRAVDAPGALFIGWEGACTGRLPTCAVVVERNVTVQAHFAPPTSTLTVDLAGLGGRVTGAGGIDCGAVCQAVLQTRTTAELTALPDAGYVLKSWTGACTGHGPTCRVELAGDQQVGANFAKATLTLTVDLTGPGTGRVDEIGAAIECGPRCTAPLAPGMAIVLVADPAAGSVFGRWGGACTGSGEVCTLTVTRSTQVSARFEQGWRLRLPLLSAGD